MPRFPKTAPVLPFRWAWVPALIFAGSVHVMGGWFHDTQFYSPAEALVAWLVIGAVMVLSLGFLACACYDESRNTLMRVLAWCRKRYENERKWEGGEHGDQEP